MFICIFKKEIMVEKYNFTCFTWMRSLCRYLIHISNDIRFVFKNTVCNGIYIPYEDTSIPKVVTCFEVLLCYIVVWFLFKGLNIAVPCFWTAWFDANGNICVEMAGKGLISWMSDERQTGLAVFR